MDQMINQQKIKRLFECSMEIGGSPVILNPRPRIPFKSMTLTDSGWTSKELYGHIAPLEMFSGTTKDMMAKLDTWLWENRQYYIVYINQNHSLGAVAFRLPTLPLYEPKLFNSILSVISHMTKEIS